MAEEAGGAGLVGADMGVLVGDDGFERTAERRQGDRVGGRPRGGEAHVGVGVEQRAHQIRRLGGDHVGPIARGEALIEMHQRLKRLGR